MLASHRTVRAPERTTASRMRRREVRGLRRSPERAHTEPHTVELAALLALLTPAAAETRHATRPTGRPVQLQVHYDIDNTGVTVHVHVGIHLTREPCVAVQTVRFTGLCRG